jgi:hypothetical protein
MANKKRINAKQFNVTADEQLVNAFKKLCIDASVPYRAAFEEAIKYYIEKKSHRAGIDVLLDTLDKPVEVGSLSNGQ